METKYTREVVYIGGKALLDAILKEFNNGWFHIVAQDPDMLVVGDNIRNVKFSRKNFRILEKFTFDTRVRAIR